MTVIKHSNGKYSIWSDMVDDFTHINITKEEYIKIRQEELKEELEKAFEKIDKNINHGVFFSLEKRLQLIEEIHGKERKNEVLKLLNNAGEHKHDNKQGNF